MKCDELKDYSILDIESIDDDRFKKEKAPGKWVPESRVYLKEDADTVIAGLKQKLQDQCISCPVKMQEDDVVAEKDNEIRRLKRALYKACANWAMAESYSVLNDVPTANRWVHTLRKLKAKLEAYK